VVNDYSLLYTWEGQGTGAPILLLAHLDVVPVEAGTEADWTQPPFAGNVADGYVWGRGALDDKASAVAILAAAELLLASGGQPQRTVIIALGHDEEVSGARGAGEMAERLRARGVAPELVLDEGGSISEGLVPGVVAPLASIGMGEKGYVSVELDAKSEGGHSSIPPSSTAIGLVSGAIARLERHQVRANLGAVMGRSLDYLGPELPFARRLVLANLWLFQPLVEWQMGQTPQTNAVIRTTTAATIFEAGVKENILPVAARAVVNFRILPGDTVDGVVEHVRTVVDDPRISLRVLGGDNNPTTLSDPDAPAFAQLSRTIRAVFPGTVVIPFLALGATDARHYTALTPNVYRFVPLRVGPQDLARVHGTNERIAVRDFVDMIRFYAELLRLPPGPPPVARPVQTNDAQWPADVGR
jgi:carboxypeptidase PM20D1